MEQKHSQGASSIAWFALSELIARREKEKALNVFRLLAHSFSDRAYVLQLEGDILWYLDDQKNCAEKYKHAAMLYEKEKRWVDAIAVYEHLFHHHPDNFQYLATLVCCYAYVDWQDQFSNRLTLLVDGFTAQKIDTAFMQRVVRSIVDIVHDPEYASTKSWLVDQLKKLSKQPDSDFAIIVKEYL